MRTPRGANESILRKAACYTLLFFIHRNLVRILPTYDMVCFFPLSIIVPTSRHQIFPFCF